MEYYGGVFKVKVSLYVLTLQDVTNILIKAGYKT